MMKSGLQKKFKEVECGGWGRTFNMACPPLPRYLFAALLGVEIMLIIMRGLPLPFPWLKPCPTELPTSIGLGDSSSAMWVRSMRKKNESCDLGMVYVYDLPSGFNSDLLKSCDKLSPWKSFCPVIVNNGYGELVEREKLPVGQYGVWYKTDQFTGEIIFHRKLMEHPCVTEDPTKARAFYVPFYVGLAVGRYLWREYPAEVRDRDGKRVIEWLEGQKFWRRNKGWDHFMMVGRITWDFRRSKDEDWGSSFLHMPGIQNATRLLIERNPWDEKEMGVPYPTAFHPRTLEDVERWQNYLRSVKRNTFFTFAGASRKFISNDFRGILLDQCKQSKSCKSLNCSGQRCANDSMAAVNLFLDSTFCLQPRGDSFTRRSIFDCLIAGSIPVFFWHRTAYWQYYWHLPSNATSYSVFISKHDVRNGTKIEEVLRAIPDAEVKRLRETVIRSIPNYVYSAVGYRLEGVKDALDIAVEGVLNRVRSLGLA